MLSEKKGNSPKVKHLTIQLMQYSCNDKSLAMENGIVSSIVWWFERRGPPKGVALLGGVALLEEVCHCGGRLSDVICLSYTSAPSAAYGSRYRTLSYRSSTMSVCMPPMFQA